MDNDTASLLMTKDQAFQFMLLVLYLDHLDKKTQI